jgi:hypothetical protein
MAEVCEAHQKFWEMSSSQLDALKKLEISAFFLFCFKTTTVILCCPKRLKFEVYYFWRKENY